MRAEIIAIGDELITGQRLDTNTQWLAERVVEIGVEVAFHTTLGDVLADNVAGFTAAIARADVIVTTGGLGPTADDLTREALARAVGVGLVTDEPSLAHIRQLFASRGRPMPDRNTVQAELPLGATAIFNRYGTAPGIAIEVQRPHARPCRIFALPGVPAEMKPMWFESVAPAIAALQDQPRVIRHRRIKCFGVGESQLEGMLPDLIRRGREPSVGITVSDATITLRITAAGADDAACQAAMQPTVDLIHQSLGPIAFGEEDQELEHVVASLLQQASRTVAVAEWATAGLIAHWLAEADSLQQSHTLAGGVTVSNLAECQRLLRLDGIESMNPNDPSLPVAMAESVRRLTGADYALAVGAYPEIVDNPDAHVHATIATPERTRRTRFGCASHPAIRTPRTAKQALNAMRLVLLDNR